VIAVDLQAEALFVSTVQPSQHPSPADVDAAITASLLRHGSEGCAALLAQECGDHPQASAERMRWCRRAVQPSVLAGAR
jgi:hypothetical protein